MGGPEAHAAHRSAAPGAALCRQPPAARPAELGRSCVGLHVRSLTRKMGIEALYRRKNTSKRHPEHVVHPYLLRGLLIDRPNQVWATDITCVLHGQRLCVPVFVDGLAHPQGAGLPPLQPSRRTSLSRRCRRLSTYTASQVPSTPIGARSSPARIFSGLLGQHEIRISMDGKGCWRGSGF